MEFASQSLADFRRAATCFRQSARPENQLFSLFDAQLAELTSTIYVVRMFCHKAFNRRSQETDSFSTTESESSTDKTAIAPSRHGF